MMAGVMITAANADQFLSVVDTESLINSDVFFGAVDEETDTAVGVLAAEAIGDHALSIRYIYVDEWHRRRGAGSELISVLQDTASEIEATAIVCALVPSEEEEPVRELLLSCGFCEEEPNEDDIALLTYAIE